MIDRRHRHRELATEGILAAIQYPTVVLHSHRDRGFARRPNDWLVGQRTRGIRAGVRHRRIGDQCWVVRSRSHSQALNLIHSPAADSTQTHRLTRRVLEQLHVRQRIQGRGAIDRRHRHHELATKRVLAAVEDSTVVFHRHSDRGLARRSSDRLVGQRPRGIRAGIRHRLIANQCWVI